MRWQEIVLLVVTVAGLAAGLLFMVKYHVKTKGSWRRYPMGRHLMGFVASVTAVFALVVTSLLLGPLPVWLWAISLGLVAIGLVHRVHMLFSERWLTQGPGSSERTKEHQTRRDR